MPANIFANSQGNFTVSDAPIAHRTSALTGLSWNFADFEAFHRAAVNLSMRDVPSGSPSVQTYRA